VSNEPGIPAAAAARPSLTATHRISVVVPVYQGQKTLAALVQELTPYFVRRTTPDGHPFVVEEVILVHDNGPDDSAAVLRQLEATYATVRTVWLSRNFGQHAATLAGMASSRGEWVITMDEDGQHNPASIPDFLDTALREGAQVVYSRPTNEPPHGFLRNTASKATKKIFGSLLSRGTPSTFQSYRLVLGEIARSLASYAGHGVYLDVALTWIARPAAYCDTELRLEDRESGYSTAKLIAHFWRLVLSSGTRALRVVSVLGVVFALVGAVFALVLLIGRLSGGITAEGWTSTIVLLLVCTGIILFALGIISEYIGIAVNMAMGRPPYVAVQDPENGPLGKARR
jgi:undecaprenyl-phosphate 4-deoxy-4-formamido-L-arabinose transferase